MSAQPAVEPFNLGRDWPPLDLRAASANHSPRTHGCSATIFLNFQDPEDCTEETRADEIQEVTKVTFANESSS